ncbi:MAG: acyl-CoA/acyl-ACP dehydrogenase [Myxococcales bacterium]|nr:acyl-CoA/acyl-ACP dehydrogenase [Myxococcales bacterium]
MNFDFSEEQKLLQETAREYLAEHSPLSACRAVLESGGSHDAELWKGAAEMGWLGAAVPEIYGGAGFGRLELSLLAMEVGRALAPIPFAPSVYLCTEAILEAGSDAQRDRWLPRLVSGEVIGSFGISEQVGRSGVAQLETRFEGGCVHGVKQPVPDVGVAGLLLAAVETGKGPGLALVELGGEGVVAENLESLDASRPLGRLTLKGAPAELLGGDGAGEAFLAHLLDRAAVLMAFEQVGGAERALEITREFTLGRFAFGRPIASFQALKHRMADIYAAIQLAASSAYYGAWALSTGDAELATAACGARVTASDAFDLATTEMIQMHGGVGYTWEYDCHLFYRRARGLGHALGSATEWREKLVQRLEGN